MKIPIFSLKKDYKVSSITILTIMIFATKLMEEKNSHYGRLWGW